MLENIKLLKEDGPMNRSELNEATAKYLANGGKVTKLPDGPTWNFQSYGVRVPKSYNVDVTALEDPGSKKQIEAVEASTL